MKCSGTKQKQLLYRIGLSLLCALQVTIALTLSTAQVIDLYHEISRVFVRYCIGFLVLFLLFFSLQQLTRRTLLMCAVSSGIMNAIAIINYYELRYHGTVLTWQDIRNIRTAWGQIGNYTFQLTPTVGAILFSYSVMLLVLTCVYNRRIAFSAQRRTGLISATGTIALCYALFLSPIAPINNDVWSWEIIYYTDGFVVGALENYHRTSSTVNKPDGYDISSIENAGGRPANTDSYPDIIMILNETYYNMDHLVDLDPDASYMENYNALDAYKGFAAVPIVGGGTNASEYELLTGNAITLLNTSTPFNDIDIKDGRTLVDYLHQIGYATMAAHSEQATNYHRGDVWPVLGFDEVYFQPDFRELSYYGQRYSASDSSLFENFIRFYESMPESQPRFGYLLTIQNHGGWDRNEPEMDLVHVHNTANLSEQDVQQINEYLTCVKQTDDFIAELVQYCSESDRRIVVYMVGDHAPSFVKEMTLGDIAESNIRLRQVPYFIWSNCDAGMNRLPENHNIDLCALTPYALFYAGLPISPYYNQLIELSKETQCIAGITAKDTDEKASIGFMQKNGTVQSVFSGTEEADMVRDYYYMEYNNLDSNNRLERLFDP